MTQLHWSAYASYGAQFVGVGLLLTAIGVNRLYVFSDDSSKTIGAFNYCATSSNGGNSYTCCSAIDTSCNSMGVSMTSDCSLFNSVRAFFVIAVIAGLLTLFINIVALTSLHLNGAPTTWFKFAGLIGGMTCVGLSLLTTILAGSSKGNLNYSTNFEASFALLIVGWVILLGATVAFCFVAREGFSAK